MKRVHPEFAYQSRELEGQVEGVLGEPPNRKNYDRMVDALVSEYTDGDGIEDVNMMAFALVDRLRFTDPQGLLREAAHYEGGDPAKVFAMAECIGDGGPELYESLRERHPDLARRAIVTAFLHKNPRLWEEDDQSLEQLAEGEENEDDMDEGAGAASDEFTQLFDQGEAE